MSALTLRLDEDVKERLEALAKASGQELHAFIGAALRMFVDDNDAIAAEIEEGAREADAGKLVSFAEVKADLLTKMAALGA